MRGLLGALIVLLWSSLAWAVVGEVGGVDTPSGTYIYEVTAVRLNYAGNLDVSYTVVAPNGGMFTVTTTLNGI